MRGSVCAWVGSRAREGSWPPRRRGELAHRIEPRSDCSNVSSHLLLGDEVIGRNGKWALRKHVHLAEHPAAVHVPKSHGQVEDEDVAHDRDGRVVAEAHEEEGEEAHEEYPATHQRVSPVDDMLDLLGELHAASPR